MNKIKRLTTRRLILRPLALSDAQFYYAQGTQEKVSGPGGFPRYKSLADSRRHIRRNRADDLKPGWQRLSLTILLKPRRELIGGISLGWPHNGVGELGYVIAPEHWGQGYATEAVRKIVDVAFARFGAHRVQATHWTRNPRSGRVLKKAGLRREGRLRGYLKRGSAVRDEFMWGITRADWLAAR